MKNFFLKLFKGTILVFVNSVLDAKLAEAKMKVNENKDIDDPTKQALKDALDSLAVQLKTAIAEELGSNAS